MTSSLSQLILIMSLVHFGPNLSTTFNDHWPFSSNGSWVSRLIGLRYFRLHRSHRQSTLYPETFQDWISTHFLGLQGLTQLYYTRLQAGLGYATGAGVLLFSFSHLSSHRLGSAMGSGHSDRICIHEGRLRLMIQHDD